MPSQQSLAVSSDAFPSSSIPQLKVVFCGSVCETAPRYICPSQVVDAIAEDMRQLDREAFYVLHLNGKNQIISKELISLGSLNQSIVHPREVFKGALLNNSAAIIGVHNHPSGDPTPSTEDKVITRRLRDCAELLGVKLLDHIIISFFCAGTRYFSFVEHGWQCDTRMQQQAVAVPVNQENKRCAWLIELRKLAGITQKQLAGLAGLKHQAVISEMERGWKEIPKEVEKSLMSILQGLITKQQQPA